MGNTVERVNAAHTAAVSSKENEAPKAKKTKLEIGAALVHQDGFKPGITIGLDQTLLEKNGSKLTIGAEAGAYLKMGRVGADLTYTKELNPNLKLGGALEGSYDFKEKIKNYTYMDGSPAIRIIQQQDKSKGYALGKAFVEYSPSSKWNLKAGVNAGEVFNDKNYSSEMTIMDRHSTETTQSVLKKNKFKAGAFAEASYNINDNLKIGAYGDSLKKEGGISFKYTF